MRCEISRLACWGFCFLSQDTHVLHSDVSIKRERVTGKCDAEELYKMSVYIALVPIEDLLCTRYLP